MLAMLKGWSAYGYDLVQRLNDAGLGEYNKGSIYRALRHMEDMGLVSSIWDTSSAGPARRMYSLTMAGTLFLQNWLAMLDMHRNFLDQFMPRSNEAASDVAPDDEADEAGAAS